MHKFARTGSLGISLLLAMHQPMRLSSQVLEPPRPRMSIAVLEGEGTINNVRNRKPTNIVVLVRDGNRNPIPGASVTFTIPPEGASAAFANGATTATVQSDKDGQARVEGIRSNSAPGPYQIQVEAKYKDEIAKGVVTQYNMTVDSRTGRSGKWVAVLAAVGAAAAAGGVVAFTRNGNGSGAGTAAPTPIGISAGSSSVGAPR